MSQYWWQDLHDRNTVWLGLELHNPPPTTPPILAMHSGHHGRMALSLRGTPLFWASMLKDHSGLWLVFNTEHPDPHTLLPPITSQALESIRRAGPEAWIGEWCRYFARHLLTPDIPLLSAGRWLLRPMLPTAPVAPYSLKQQHPVESWRFYAPARSGNIGFSWSLFGEDIPNLMAPARVSQVDWWWSGNPLLARYAIQPDTGRLKWWRKKSREGALPPVLVRYVAGLGSFVILDGHYRLQAAIAEGIPPQFLVLSELAERTFPANPVHQEKITRALAAQQQKNPAVNIDGVNQTLINLYDSHDLYAPAYSRAVLGNGEGWAREVTAYLRRHNEDAVLDSMLKRIAN
ncbi:ParB/Srx family N-terminal domain-containing protein [Erwinia sp. AnSW2-5]|uniref:ParB/Srx family N-terminal domain-containing protein n=1 Tax=Erwinia sp. AnSW2-5 TaxID=3367692 RepID=UPI00385B21FE